MRLQPKKMGALFVCVFSAIVQAQSGLPQKIAWAPLFDSKLLDWLENENRIEYLCPKDMQPAHRRHCIKTMLAPKESTLQLYAHSDRHSAMLGSLHTRYQPGKPLQIIYRSEKQKKEIEFTPDLYDSDWGYGPWFHQTIQARKGSWIQLPARPFATPVWFDSATLSGFEPMLLNQGDFVRANGSAWLVVEISNAILRVRQEQASDLACNAEEDQKNAEPQTVDFSFKSLLDADSHWKLTFSYMRGC